MPRHGGESQRSLLLVDPDIPIQRSELHGMVIALKDDKDVPCGRREPLLREASVLIIPATLILPFALFLFRTFALSGAIAFAAAGSVRMPAEITGFESVKIV